jgi:hypothetical protein
MTGTASADETGSLSGFGEQRIRLPRRRGGDDGAGASYAPEDQREYRADARDGRRRIQAHHDDADRNASQRPPGVAPYAGPMGGSVPADVRDM